MPENKKRQALKRTTSRLAIYQTESLRLSGFFPWKGNGLNIKDYTDFLNAVKEVMMEIHAWRLIAILITAVLLVLVWRLPEILNALPPLLRGL